MPTSVIMPKFEMAQETGTVSNWLKNEGDAVKKGEAILEVETDKVTMEVEAPASGILVGIKVGPSAVVPIGETIAYIIQPGEPWPDEDVDRHIVSKAPTSPPATATPPSRATPLAQRIAEAHGVDIQSIPGAGATRRVTGKDVESYLVSEASQATHRESPTGKIRAVPAARRLAREMDVSLETITGTGPGGRIQSDDVRQAAEKLSPSLVAPAQPVVRRTIPLTSMRRTIAERMTASIRLAPQFTASIDLNMSRALSMIDDLRQEAEPTDGPRVTLTTFLVKVCSWTLTRHPALNAALDSDNILEWDEINIGVAVAVRDGLVVPVIRRADQLSIRDVAGQLADLATRARDGRLRPEDVQGGTFTLSNLGMFGIDRFTAILNPPQAGILAVGRVSKQAIVEADQVKIQPMATFTLTADHRVVDGAIVGRFLSDLQQAIEHPGLLL